ncbi:unnamed protein product, partial [Gulo gulo]
LPQYFGVLGELEWWPVAVYAGGSDPLWHMIDLAVHLKPGVCSHSRGPYTRCTK